MNVNLYYTKWMDKCDKTTVRSGEIKEGPLAGQYYSLSLSAEWMPVTPVSR